MYKVQKSPTLPNLAIGLFRIYIGTPLTCSKGGGRPPTRPTVKRGKINSRNNTYPENGFFVFRTMARQIELGLNLTIKKSYF